VPLLDEVLAIDDPDVLGAFLSGAGPSVALLVRREAADRSAALPGRIEKLLMSLYARAGVDATIRTLHVHQTTPTPALSLEH
jgi:homoserine kinase